MQDFGFNSMHALYDDIENPIRPDETTRQRIDRMQNTSSIPHDITDDDVYYHPFLRDRSVSAPSFGYFSSTTVSTQSSNSSSSSLPFTQSIHPSPSSLTYDVPHTHTHPHRHLHQELSHNKYLSKFQSEQESKGMISQNQSKFRDGSAISKRKKKAQYFEEKKAALYKTELCRPFMEGQACKFGTDCIFAHGHAELRPLLKHPRYKTEICKSFWESGCCGYGIRCCFLHVLNDKSSSSPRLKSSSVQDTKNIIGGASSGSAVGTGNSLKKIEAEYGGYDEIGTTPLSFEDLPHFCIQDYFTKHQTQ